MKILQLLKLSHADFVTRRKVIIFSVIAAGIPFVILMTLNLLMQGAANIAMREAGRTTDGAMYLTVAVEDAAKAQRTLDVVLGQGELVTRVTAEEVSKYETPLDMFSALTGVEYNAHLLEGDTNFGSFRYKKFAEDEDVRGFAPARMLIDNATAYYYVPYDNQNEDLLEELSGREIYLVKFPTVEKAYEAYRYFRDHHRSFDYEEIFSNALAGYINYRQNDGVMMLLGIVGMIIATVIVIGTYVYLLDQSMRSVVIYRALGANTLDLIMITLGYIIEVSITLVLSVLAVSLLIALIFSGLQGSYVTELFTEFYGYAPSSVVMVGFNERAMWIILDILLAAPVSLLLTLDQFSVKRLSRKLKRE